MLKRRTYATSAWYVRGIEQGLPCCSGGDVEASLLATQKICRKKKKKKKRSGWRGSGQPADGQP
jgi:hypothetical protein